MGTYKTIFVVPVTQGVAGSSPVRTANKQKPFKKLKGFFVFKIARR